MKLPRDIGGEQLATRLRIYGYQVTCQTGSHIRLVTTLKGKEHHVTIVRHNPLKVGTLDGVMKEVASYLGTDKQTVIDELFK